jgi:hypothetical protein
MVVADVVRLAQPRREALVVLAQLREHVERIDVVGVVVRDALGAGDVADRAQRRAADLADALRGGVGHRVELVRLLVEQQVIVAEVRAAHVPVEVLGLEVEREHVGEDAVQCAGDILDGGGGQVGGGGQGRLAADRRFVLLHGGLRGEEDPPVYVAGRRGALEPPLAFSTGRAYNTSAIFKPSSCWFGTCSPAVPRLDPAALSFAPAGAVPFSISFRILKTWQPAP